MALDALLADSVPGVLTAEHREQQLEDLANLKRALDDYSDLLVAEGRSRSSLVTPTSRPK